MHIRIHDGTGTVSLTKTEAAKLRAAKVICEVMAQNYQPASDVAAAAAERLGDVLEIAADKKQ